MKKFAFFTLLMATFWASDAEAHALSCTNPYKYTYFTEDPKVASKCRSNFDGDCNWKSTAMNCTWQGSYKGTQGSASEPASPKPKPTATETSTGKGSGSNPNSSKTKTPAAPASTHTAANKPTYSKTHTQTETKTKLPISSSTRTDTSPATVTESSYAPETPVATNTEEHTSTETTTETETPVKKNLGLEEAVKEANISAGKVQELKITMEEIKVNNQNNAILYRSPDANLGSADPRFNAFGAGISGEAGKSGSAGGLLGKDRKSVPGAMDFKATKGTKDAKGRGLASTGAGEADLATSGDTSASVKGENSSATSDNPWVTYMGQTSKAGLIDRLRKNPGLRDSLRGRIAELQAKGDHTGVVELMEEALAAADKESQEPSLDNLKPMGVMEAFSMNASETEAQIRSLLADLDSDSDPQFLPQASLFERVSVAHRRSLLRGSIKSNR